jgi:hypothetical protein
MALPSFAPNLRPRAAIGILTAMLCVILSPGPAASTDFRERIRTKVLEARRLQTPNDALSVWGDPLKLWGSASPEMLFWFDDTRDKTVTQVTLKYLPPARHPTRLEWFQVAINKPPSEQELLGWLGQPLRIEKDDLRGRLLIYDGRDRAGLGVSLAFWSTSGNLTMHFPGATK